jgi:hypothetical protein
MLPIANTRSTGGHRLVPVVPGLVLPRLGTLREGLVRCCRSPLLLSPLLQCKIVNPSRIQQHTTDNQPTIHPSPLLLSPFLQCKIFNPPACDQAVPSPADQAVPSRAQPTVPSVVCRRLSSSDIGQLIDCCVNPSSSIIAVHHSQSSSSVVIIIGRHRWS